MATTSSAGGRTRRDNTGSQPRHSRPRSYGNATARSKRCAASTWRSRHGRNLRPDRPRRRGQDLDVPDSRRRDGSHRRRGRNLRPAGARGAFANRIPDAGVQPLSRPHRDRKTSATSAICGAFRRTRSRSAAHRYLQMFDMDRFANRLAGQLSGGMKQKLSLVCALVPEPHVLLLDEPTTGVDPVSRREFWDTLAHLAADGLTILVATPYLDEAERCHRVALMHLGEIRQIGHAGRIARESARQAARAAHAESARGRAGACRSQRPRPGHLRRAAIRRPPRSAGARPRRSAARCSTNACTPPACASSDIRVDDRRSKTPSSPRSARLGQEMHETPFPGRRDHIDLRGQIAIGAQQSDQAIRRLHRRERRQPARCATARFTACSAPTAPARPPRSRCSAACSTPPAEQCNWRASAAQPALAERAPADRLHVAEIFALRRSDDPARTSTSSPASTACPTNEREEKSAMGAFVFRPRRQAGPDHRQPAGRLEAARGVRRGHHARAERALSRRADFRRRSAGAPRFLDA